MNVSWQQEEILLKSDDCAYAQPKVQVQEFLSIAGQMAYFYFGEDQFGAKALFFRHSNTKTENLTMWSSAKPGLEKDPLLFFQGCM